MKPTEKGILFFRHAIFSRRPLSQCRRGFFHIRPMSSLRRHSLSVPPSAPATSPPARLQFPEILDASEPSMPRSPRCLGVFGTLFLRSSVPRSPRFLGAIGTFGPRSPNDEIDPFTREIPSEGRVLVSPPLRLPVPLTENIVIT